MKIKSLTRIWSSDILWYRALNISWKSEIYDGILTQNKIIPSIERHDADKNFLQICIFWYILVISLGSFCSYILFQGISEQLFSGSTWIQSSQILKSLNWNFIFSCNLCISSMYFKPYIDYLLFKIQYTWCTLLYWSGVVIKNLYTCSVQIFYFGI